MNAWRVKTVITGGYVSALGLLGLTSVISKDQSLSLIIGWCVTDMFIAILKR